MFLLCAVALFSATCLLVLFRSHKRWPEDPEPPIVQSSIPFIGHIIGIIRHRGNYYNRLRDKTKLPILTLPISILGLRIYVVNSVNIIQSVQKNVKTLAYQPIEATFSVRLCGASRKAYNILAEDMDLDNGHFGSIFKAMHPPLAPGPGLHRMNGIMVQRVSEYMELIKPSIGMSSKIKLADWVRHHVTLATTDAAYGPHNPFRNPDVENAFWEFEQRMPELLFLPGWLPLYSKRQRKIVLDAFEHYFAHNYHKTGSALVTEFYDTEQRYGFDHRDSAAFHAGTAIALLSNTSAAVFWMIFYVFSTPEALHAIRDELARVVTTKGEGKTKTHHIDFTKVDVECPTLVSTFSEALRVRSIGTSLRKVVKDTIVGNEYLLRKGSFVLMPTPAIHTDARVWGEDVEEFRYDRFVKSKVSRAAFRSFGGGSTLCPGRHFATLEVMAWTIMLVLRYDITPADGQVWEAPPTEKTNMATVITTPDYDIDVELSNRAGPYQDGSWEYQLSDSEATFAITDEDWLGMEDKRP